MLRLRDDGGIRVPQRRDFIEDFAQVEAFHIDSVFLQSDFVETNGFERGGPGTDTAEVETLHPVDNPADSGKIPEIFPELFAQGMNNVGFEHGEGNTVLSEHIRDGELAAVSIAAMGKIHLSDFIRVGLHQDRDAGILQGSDGPVFIREDRHGEDDAVILSVMLLQPFRIKKTFLPGFDSAVTGQFLFHGDVAVAGLCDGFDHFRARFINQLARHETAVGKGKGKGQFSVHSCFSSLKQIVMV